MEQKTILMGGAGLIGLLILVAIFESGSDEPAIEDVIAGELTPLSDTVTALNERIAALESSLEGVSEQVATTPEALAEIETQVQNALTETGSLRESLDTIQGTLAETIETVEETVEAVRSQPVAAAPAPVVSDDAPAPAAAAPAGTDAGAGEFGPGTTALFADGALRLFVSRLDPEAGEVRVSVGGQMEVLPEGSPRMFAAGAEYCRITADTIAASGVAFSSLCGDELPDPEGISAGETALFADGALRVFASLIGDRDARFSINGELASIDLGRSVPVMAGEASCRVYLDALDRGHATVSALCGDDVPVSEAAGPGETVVLGEGAARVFVAAVQDDVARFAVNGQNVVSGGLGETVTLSDGCAVTVEDIMDGAVSFSHACSE